MGLQHTVRRWVAGWSYWWGCKAWCRVGYKDRVKGGFDKSGFKVGWGLVFYKVGVANVGRSTVSGSRTQT